MKKKGESVSGEGDCEGTQERTLIRVAGANLAQIIDETDWERVDRLTDADIDQAIADDPDAAPALEDAFWRNCRDPRSPE